MTGERPVVEARDVFCLYPLPGGATVAALRGLTLTVAPRERVVVHGPNGSGKTTLLRVLTGEQPVSAGRLRVAGEDVVGVSAAAAARLRLRSLGYVDQQAASSLRPELTVLDNVALQLRLAGASPRAAQQAAHAALAVLEIDQLAARRPQTLSGGEAQRVAVAAALAHRPPLLLADEPTGELDRASADTVYTALAAAALAVGAALVLVTHDVAAARVADRVVRLRDGRLSEQWAPDRPDDERLVVDDRGWLRLPEPVRRELGNASLLRASGEPGRVTLHPDAAPVPHRPAVAALPAGAPAPPAPRSAPYAGRVAGVDVRVDEVSVAYGGRVVVDRLSFAVPAGQLAVVRGRSGTGKSTLLRVVAGLQLPDRGEVTVGAQPLGVLDRAGRAALRRGALAVVGQGVELPAAYDVTECLACARAVRGLPPDDAAVARWLDRLDLTALRRRRVAWLSGGERQRLAAARALVTGAPVVVLDEPTSALDEAHVELVAAALREAADLGHTVICASHDPVMAAAADQVVDVSPVAGSPILSDVVMWERSQ